MPQFIVTFDAPLSTTDVAGVRRLRAMLKRLGRGYGLRCVDIRQADDGAPAVAPKSPKPLEAAALCGSSSPT